MRCWVALLGGSVGFLLGRCWVVSRPRVLCWVPNSGPCVGKESERQPPVGAGGSGSPRHQGTRDAGIGLAAPGSHPPPPSTEREQGFHAPRFPPRPVGPSPCL